MLISTILKNTYKLEIAHDSHEAIKQIYKCQPDLVTLDISMPGLEGDKLLPVIRAWKPTIPVLVISANYDLETQEKCIKRESTGFLPKSFEMKHLLNNSLIFVEFQNPTHQFFEQYNK